MNYLALDKRLMSVALVTLVAVLLAACSGDPTPPRELLLDPADFPGEGFTETSREDSETNLNQPAVQVELSSPGLTVLESLVLFETEERATTILAGIKQDQRAQGVASVPVEGFYDNSGVIQEQLHGEDASTLFFVEGRALVRITVSGEGQADRVWEIAGLAREKSGT
jgi:hypothetical protein